MATYIARADGNLTAAATWGLVDATSLLESVGGFSVVPTNDTGLSAAFTPGAIEIDGIAVKLNYLAGATGTVEISLRLSADGSLIAGTAVTINLTDLNVYALGSAAAAGQRWFFVKFAAPVLLLAATAYKVKAKASNANQIYLYTNGTAVNWCRFLRTTTTAAPGAGDNMAVLKEWTAPATGTARAVTMDDTAGTDYGTQASVSDDLAVLWIGDGCSLTFGVAAATAYELRVSGNIWNAKGATINEGTLANPLPRDSTARIRLDPAANGNYGIWNWGTRNHFGQSRTVGKNVTRCKATADIALGAVAIAVDTDTGWLSGDEVIIGASARTAQQGETRTLTGDAGAAQLDVAATGFAHPSTAPRQTRVILMARNVTVETVTTNLSGWIVDERSATVNAAWTKFQSLGYSVKQGIQTLADAGQTVAYSFCSFHGMAIASSYGLSMTRNAAGGCNPVLTDCVFSGVASYGVYTSGSYYNGRITLTDCGFHFYGAATADAIYIASACTIAFSGLSGSGTTGSGIKTNISAPADGLNFRIGTITAPEFHTMGGTGGNAALSLGGTLGGLTVHQAKFWRCTTSGAGQGAITFNTAGTLWDVLFTDGEFVGNLTAHIGDICAAGGTIQATFRGCTLDGEAGYATLYGWNGQSAQGYRRILFENSPFGATVAHTTEDFSATSAYRILGEFTLVNSPLNAATEFGVTFLQMISPGSFVAQQRADGVTNVHTATLTGIGTVSRHAAAFRTAAPSEKLTPASSVWKLESAPARADVLMGTAKTFGVYVYLDAAYNGNPPRLIARANPAIGMDDDQILDTHSGATGAWELLSGLTTPVAEEDGAIEVFVDCDGTAGFALVDDWSVS